MNISKKIEEIRKKPEHVRLRYVWGAVVVSMFFIILIWVFSIKQNIKSSKENNLIIPDLKSELKSQNQNLPSIDSLMNSEIINNPDPDKEEIFNNIDNNNENNPKE